MEKVYLLGACRTPIGKMGGALASKSAVELGTIVINESIKRSGVSPSDVDHVFMGCVIQAGLGQNVARQTAINAGLPYSTTAETINIVCGSGLDAVNSAARLIMSGDADVVIACGAESMSNAPFVLKEARYGYRMGSPMINTPLIDAMVNDALWDTINNYHMGITAENIAMKYSISRREADEYALASHQKAVAAIAEGRFREEIVPVVVSNRKGSTTIDTDEGPRSDTSIQALAKLKPAFKTDGIVTAGNSSGINDGAAAIVLISEKKVNELNLCPQAEWVGGSLGGVDPSIMGIGPVISTKRLLDKLNMSIDDIDLIEGNEAFATQIIAVNRDLCVQEDKTNVNGGAIALGHPVGASGCRILVSLLYAMKQREAHTGLATLCIGGGMGCSTIIKRV